MNIQAEDGKWYIDPAWDGPNFRVYADMMCDEIILNYKGQVLWNTARRVLNQLGIKAKLDMVKSNGYLMVEGRIAESSIFSLRLTRPIPVPQDHEGFFDEAPNPLHNGRTLSWKICGKRWTPVGETS